MNQMLIAILHMGKLMQYDPEPVEDFLAQFVEKQSIHPD